jgi:hypothetical protein
MTERPRSPRVVTNVRFLLSLLPAFLLLGAFFGVIGLVSTRIPGMLGGLLGFAAGASLVVAALLAYWNAVDWWNLRLVRNTASGAPPVDGASVAFEGVVRVDGAPLVAPLSGTRCAAYTYVVSHSPETARGQRERRVLLQGFHLVRTRLAGAAGSVALASFPSFETALREEADGSRWGRAAAALSERLAETAPSAGEREREARLLAARSGEVEEVHEDFRMGAVGEDVAPLVLEEELLPVDEQVCVIGTYDEARRRLVARRSRLGPDLVVYRGGANEVVERVGGELGGYVKAALVLAGVGAAIVGFATLA